MTTKEVTPQGGEGYIKEPIDKEKNIDVKTKKEPWEMRKTEYIDKYYQKIRQFIISTREEDTAGNKFYSWKDILGEWEIRKSRIFPYYIVYLNGNKLRKTETLKEATIIRCALIHKNFVIQALKEDKNIPPEVLKDYPDIIRR